MNELSRIGEPEDYNLLTDSDFRGMVRSWVEASYPPDIRNPPKRLHWSENKVWYFKLAEKGWLCPACGSVRRIPKLRHRYLR